MTASGTGVSAHYDVTLARARDDRDDIGAGTGAFAAAFADWFGLGVLAVEPSAAMRARIPARPGIRVLGGHACAFPLADGSADAAWLSTVIDYIADLEAAARDSPRSSPRFPGAHPPGIPRQYATGSSSSAGSPKPPGR